MSFIKEVLMKTEPTYTPTPNMRPYTNGLMINFDTLILLGVDDYDVYTRSKYFIIT
mgnify:CR=1 FL=1